MGLVSEADRKRYLRIQRYEPYGPWVPCSGFGEREWKLPFGRVEDGALLFVGERVFTPDQQSCGLVCFAVEENSESGMWMSMILQR